MRVNAFDDDFGDTPMGLEDDLADYNQREAEDYLHEDDQHAETTSLYVNVYDVVQQYGGPEEGGWTYNSGEFLEGIPAANEQEAEEIRNKLEAKYNPDNSQRKPFGSVKLNNPEKKIPDNWEPTSQADDESYVHYEGRIHVYIEDHPGHDFPTERPHYE